MNRRTVAIAALFTVPAVSGCQALDDALSHFGPRPNEALSQLARSAIVDAGSLRAEDPDLSALRDQQADELIQEIHRLCGLEEKGEPPQSCAAPAEEDGSADEPPAKNAREAADRELALVDKAPEESRDLLVEQSIQLLERAYAASPDAATGLDSTNAGNSAPLPPAPAAGKLSDTVSDLLAWEDSAVYGLDVARAFVPAGKINEVDTLNGLYSQRAEALRQATQQGAASESRAAALPATHYSAEPDAPELPHDEPSAVKFLAALETNDDQEWTRAATDAAHIRDSEWLVWLADQAARGRAI